MQASVFLGPQGTNGCILSICSAALGIEPLNKFARHKGTAIRQHMFSVCDCGRVWERNCLRVFVSVFVSVWSSVCSPSARFLWCAEVFVKCDVLGFVCWVAVKAPWEARLRVAI